MKQRDSIPGGLVLAFAAGLAITLGTAGAGAAVLPYPEARDPGGDPRAHVAVPPAGRWFGFHEEAPERRAMGWSADEMAEVAAGAGANLHRFTINWSHVEPLEGVWDEAAWAEHQRLYDALLERGIRPLITLGVPPAWARLARYQDCPGVRGCEYPPARANEDAWAHFAGEVVTRFPETAAVEVWNEPNMNLFWKPFPRPAKWARLVVATYQAVKAAAPGVAVLAGGLAPAVTTRRVNGRPATIAMGRFLGRAYKARSSIKRHSDGISFHYVTNARRHGRGTLWAKAFESVRRARSAHGERHLRLWLSEVGAWTSGPLGLTRRRQAGTLLRRYRRLMTMPDVEAVVLHTLGDRLEFSRNDDNFGQGVVARWDPFRPKRAYCTFAGRVRVAEPYGACRKIREAPDNRCSERLSKLTRLIRRSHGDRRRTYKREYRETAIACVPCRRRIATIRRQIRESSGAERRQRRAALHRVRERCVPCLERLGELERRTLRAGPIRRSIIFRKHRPALRRCAARR